MRLLARAASMVQTINGLPPRWRIFLRGRRLLPPRAAIRPRMRGVLVSDVEVAVSKEGVLFQLLFVIGADGFKQLARDVSFVRAL